MTAHNWIITLLETLGLKSSEEKRLQREIADCEERIRSLNREIKTLIEEIKELELRGRDMKKEYDSQKGVSRETVRIRLENLLKQLKHYKERNTLLAQNLNAETLVRHNLLLKLNHLLHNRPADDLWEIRTEKENLIAEENENAAASAKLDNTSLPQKTKNTLDDNDFEAAIKNFN